MFILLLSVWLHPPTLPTRPEPLPPLSDLARFPSAATCEYQLAFLDARRAWLGDLHLLYMDRGYQCYFDDALADVRDRREPWRILHDAHAYAAPGRSDAYRGGVNEDGAQQMLFQLRVILGPREFEAGRMTGLIDPEFWRRAD